MRKKNNNLTPKDYKSIVFRNFILKIMKKKTVNIEIYSCRVTFLIGKKDEVWDYMNKRLYGPERDINFEKSEDQVEQMKLEEKAKFKTIAGLCSSMKLCNDGVWEIFMVVFPDKTPFMEVFKRNRDTRAYKKALKSVYYHELRHVVDKIVNSWNLDYKDRENTAKINEYLGPELEETRDEFISDELPGILEQQA